MLGRDGAYQWQASDPAESAGSIEICDFLAEAHGSTRICGLIELDIADPERFIAETTPTG